MSRTLPARMLTFTPSCLSLLPLSLSLLPFLSPPRSPFLLTLFFYCIINLIFLCNVCITVRFYCPCQCPLPLPLPSRPLSQSCEKSITCTQVLRVLALSSRLLMLALWLVLRFTILANFCFLEVSPPRAKGIIFYPAPLSLFLLHSALLLRLLFAFRFENLAAVEWGEWSIAWS